MNLKNSSLLLLLMLSAVQCVEKSTEVKQQSRSYDLGSFGYDLNFMQKFQNDLIVLGNDSLGANIVISPQYQGRVMTSSSNGFHGMSYGWINYDLIGKGEVVKHMNAYGGEERLWLGPEGGQYAIFFQKGVDFNFQNWQTPPAIDTEPFEVVRHDNHRAVVKKQIQLENYSGTSFKINILREISMLDKLQAEAQLKMSLDEVKWVAYQTKNELQNIGISDWDKKSGVLSIWLLGMMTSTAQNTIIIPIKKGFGNAVNDSYFGNIASDRLVVKDQYVLFKGDAKSRGKIGIPPQALIPIAGSYDAQHKVLTIIEFDYAGDTDYVNSVWGLQKEPYKGDVLNAYNDGKNETGMQMGNFYELESSSPAKTLKINESVIHTQRTYHFEGSEAALSKLTEHLFGVKLAEIKIDGSN